MSTRTAFRVSVGIVAAMAAAVAAAQTTAYVVVVNSANPHAEISRDELARLFLKKTPRWPHGVNVQPVDLEIGSSVREGFSLGVLGRRPEAVKGYWLKMVFDGRQTPPLTLTNDEDVLRFVGSQPGAIGYVSSTATLGKGVKVLRLLDEKNS